MPPRVSTRLQDVGKGVWAYTQLPGSWGWSNAGLIADGEQSLLVDTLFDLRITADMLATMRQATPAAAHIDTVVNTHGNGDHCYGNALVDDAEIVGTVGCLQDLAEAPPRRNALLLRLARLVRGLGPAGRGLGRACSRLGVSQLSSLIDAAPFALELFGDFDFPRTAPTLPTRTFEERFETKVGDKRVEVVAVGPAHTRGDAYVYVPDDRVVFTGDLLFANAHPVIWEGPVSNWVAACKRLLALDVDVVVPGHGPVTDKSSLEETVTYLELLQEETRRRHAAGLSLDETIRDLTLDAYQGWLDPERIVVNVGTLYRELEGRDRSDAPHVLEQFARMARYREGRF